MFHVSTDYLLKDTEPDELTIRTERLEKGQEELKMEIINTHVKHIRIWSTAFIYAAALAVFLYLQLPLPYLFPDADMRTRVIELAAILLIATAISIQVNLRIMKKYMKNLITDAKEKGADK